MSLIEKKYKKLVKELLFVYSELEYTSEAAKNAHPDFEAYYQQYCAYNNVPIKELQEKNEAKQNTSSKQLKLITIEIGLSFLTYARNMI